MNHQEKISHRKIGSGTEERIYKPGKSTDQQTYENVFKL